MTLNSVPLYSVYILPRTRAALSSSSRSNVGGKTGAVLHDVNSDLKARFFTNHTPRLFDLPTYYLTDPILKHGYREWLAIAVLS